MAGRGSLRASVIAAPHVHVVEGGRGQKAVEPVPNSEDVDAVEQQVAGGRQ